MTDNNTGILVQNGKRQVSIKKTPHSIELSVMRNGFQSSGHTIDEELLDMVEAQMTIFNELLPEHGSKKVSGDRGVSLSTTRYGIDFMTMRNGHHWFGSEIDMALLDMILHAIKMYKRVHREELDELASVDA